MEKIASMVAKKKAGTKVKKATDTKVKKTTGAEVKKTTDAKLHTRASDLSKIRKYQKVANRLNSSLDKNPNEKHLSKIRKEVKILNLRLRSIKLTTKLDGINKAIMTLKV